MWERNVVTIIHRMLNISSRGIYFQVSVLDKNGENFFIIEPADTCASNITQPVSSVVIPTRFTCYFCQRILATTY